MRRYGRYRFTWKGREHEISVDGMARCDLLFFRLAQVDKTARDYAFLLALRESEVVMIEFRSFPKIARLSRACVISEKIDGTNGQIFIGDDGEFLVGSRTRWITPDDDNYGFARWAYEHKEELMLLGAGSHFGEWWGGSIQRGYGLTEKRFSLFNVSRWADPAVRPPCCHVVPVLFEGIFHSDEVAKALVRLSGFGSVAAPGFRNPEGVVIYLSAANVLLKKTCEHDDEPKLAHVKKDRPPKPPRDRNIGGRRKGGGADYAGADRRVV